MSDWIGLAIILLIIVGGLVAASRLGAPPEKISQEEFDRRVREGAATRGAMFALQQWLHPKGADAVAVQQDLRHGYYNKKKIPGDGDDAAADAKKLSSSEPQGE
ncbi:MAG TPA: hypothetical protein VER76_10610 [Pyrinomonadaceae bacterium]|nr:hypothetical protein [Pyrinomonadaceae bacterium]